MNEQSLSLRLTRVGEQVPEQARLADIGSDHAYLPVALMLQNKIQYAVAGEVVKGPFESASRQVMKNGLNEKITVRLADGLAAIQPEDQINTVVIAGMGGTLIRTILEKGTAHSNITGKERLVLQPNVGERTLREWLQENNYQIVHEELIEENHKNYEIIVAEAGHAIYSPQELFFGPFLLKEKNLVFHKKWSHELQQRKIVLQELEKAATPPEAKIQELKEQIAWIEEVLS
jgi:tRNA (adenine22-N1)-methyltransferase